MPKTFLELLNDAIDESKIQLDPLTNVNFDDPPRTVMYNRFKKWINMAYKELLIARPEWYFRKERTTMSVWPRLQLAGLTTIPSVGDVLTGLSSGVVFTIEAIHNIEDVEEDSIDERTVSVTFSDNSNPDDLILKETFSGTDGVSTYTAGYYKGLGRYSFKSDITNLQEIDPYSVRIYDTPEDAVDSPVIPREGSSIAYVPWDKWQNEYSLHPWAGDYPIVICETPLGTYEMYPLPARESILTFDFTRKITDLVNYDDVPEGLPEEYHDYLSWRAVEEFADFDSNPKLFSRARKHTENYRNWLDRDQKQEVRFEESRF